MGKLKYFRITVRRRRLLRPSLRHRLTKKYYLAHKDRALSLVKNRIAHFNQFYNFKFNKINIKNQKTRWGSCSRKGNLNFNYRLALISEKLADYIIVHELCHLGQFNHSKKFWDLVAQTMPDYTEARRELKKQGIRYR